jgi:hypothetical protein
MSFAICPDNGPPRLWRFVGSGELGYVGGAPIVAILLPGNILKIDRELYEQLPWIEQHQLLRTTAAFTIDSCPTHPLNKEPQYAFSRS